MPPTDRLRRVATAYTQEQLDEAVNALSDPERFRAAEAAVAAAAPTLQRILGQALTEGGWFAGSHDDEVAKALGEEDPPARGDAIRTLLAEEARTGMLVGVAVGWALQEELSKNTT